MAGPLERAAAKLDLGVQAVVQDRAALRRTLSVRPFDLVLLAATFDEPLDGLRTLSRDELFADTATVLVVDEIDEEVLEALQQVVVDGVLAWPAKRAQMEVTVHAALGARRERSSTLRERLGQSTDALQRIAEALGQVAHIIPAVPVRPVLRPLPELASLSPREWEVLRGLVGHQRVSTLARDMDISPHTVRNHLKSIFAKLSVHSQVELLEKVIDKRAGAVGMEIEPSDL